MNTCIPYGCPAYRNSLSALFDGEPGDLPTDLVQTHLAACPGCSAWYAGAQAIDRRVRVRAAEPVPDITEALLRSVLAERPRALFPVLVARAGLIVVAGPSSRSLYLCCWGCRGVSGASMQQADKSGAWNLGLTIALATAAAPLVPTVRVLAATFNRK